MLGVRKELKSQDKRYTIKELEALLSRPFYGPEASVNLRLIGSSAFFFQRDSFNPIYEYKNYLPTEREG